MTRTLVLCVAMTALIGGVVAYRRAHAEPNPLLAYGLDVCDGKACFIGITPGVTKWGEVRARVHGKHFEFGNEQEVVVGIGKTQFGVVANSNSDTLPVLLIVGNPMKNVDYDQNFPRAGDFLTQYGLPCGVRIAELYDSGVTQLSYPSMTITVRMSGRNGSYLFGAVSPVEYVILGGFDPEACPERANPLSVPWQGFVSFDHYRRLGSSREQAVP